MPTDFSLRQKLWGLLLLCAPLPVFLLSGFDLLPSLGFAAVTLLLSLVAVTALELRSSGLKPRRFLSRLSVVLGVAVAATVAYTPLVNAVLEQLKERISLP